MIDVAQLLLEANKADLHKDHIADLEKKFAKALDRLGKDETIPIKTIERLYKEKKIPTLVKHAVVAIFDSIPGNYAERFLGAHNIAYWSLSRHGFINSGNWALTGRGSLRDRYHKAEKDSSSKNQRYKSLYNVVLGAW